MSFLRPEAVARLRRWREPLVLSLAVALTLRLVWLGFARDSLFLGLVGGLGLAAALSLFYVSVLRARLHLAGGGRGVVDVREWEIAYYGPEGGGVVSLSELKRVDLSNTTDEKSWILWGYDGALVIPVHAEGADALIEVFTALPGISLETVNRALASSAKRIDRIWEMNG